MAVKLRLLLLAQAILLLARAEAPVSSTELNRQSALWLRKDLRRAKDLAAQAHEQAVREGNVKQQTRSLLLLGEAAALDYDTESVARYVVQSEPLITSIDDPGLRASWLHLKAKAAATEDPSKVHAWLEEAINLYDQAGDELGLADCYYTLGIWDRFQDLAAESLEAQQIGMLIRDRSGDAGGKGLALQGVGLAYRSMGETAKSIEPFRQSAEIQRQLGNGLLLGRVLVNLATSYQETGQLARALEAGLEALRVMQQTGDNPLGALNNLANIYQGMGDNRKALEYSMEALEIRKKSGDLDGLATALNNVGLIYQKSGETRLAIDYFNKALDAARQSKDPKTQAFVLGNLGYAYHNAGEQQKALAIQTQALKIRQQLKDRKGIAYSLENLGATNLALHRPHVAVEQIREALKIASELQLAQVQADGYADLARAYAALELFEEAYQAQVKHSQLQNMLNGEQANRRVQEVQARHDLYKSERQLETLQQESRIRDLELARKTLQNKLLVSLVAFGCLLLAAAIHAYQNKRRANEALQQAALTDSLTGLRNRRFFDMTIASEVRRVARIHEEARGEPKEDLLFFVLDLDYFKSINDAHGHAAGDGVLREAARRLLRSLRASDYIFRWGGEEFLVVARGSRRTEAPVIAKSIMDALGAKEFELPGGGSARITISGGFAVFDQRWPASSTASACVQLADRALYQAKHSGRNCSVGLVARAGSSEPEQILVRGTSILLDESETIEAEVIS